MHPSGAPRQTVQRLLLLWKPPHTFSPIEAYYTPAAQDFETASQGGASLGFRNWGWSGHMTACAVFLALGPQQGPDY